MELVLCVELAQDAEEILDVEMVPDIYPLLDVEPVVLDPAEVALYIVLDVELVLAADQILDPAEVALSMVLDVELVPAAEMASDMVLQHLVEPVLDG